MFLVAYDGPLITPLSTASNIMIIILMIGNPLPASAMPNSANAPLLCDLNKYIQILANYNVRTQQIIIDRHAFTAWPQFDKCSEHFSRQIRGCGKRNYYTDRQLREFINPLTFSDPFSDSKF